MIAWGIARRRRFSGFVWYNPRSGALGALADSGIGCANCAGDSVQSDRIALPIVPMVPVTGPLFGPVLARPEPAGLHTEDPRKNEPMNMMSIRDGWMLPTEEQAQRALATAQRDFRRTLAAWAGDVLALRRDNMLTPRWCIASEDEWQLAA